MPPSAPDAVIGDRLRLRQVLVNLIGNAIKFTPRGEVTVRVAAASQSSQQVELEFAVADTGIGIARKDLARIFQPFTQADSSTTRLHNGAGLGLAIASSLVSMMGGQLCVTSELGRGSTFSFTARLELQPETAALPPAPRSAFDPLQGQAGFVVDEQAPLQAPPPSLRILLAEDTPANQKLVLHILRKRGHVVAIAGNGAEAVEMARRQSYDVVLMDVQMPIMDGFQATEAIRLLERDHQARVPIVAMTAHAMKGDRQRCLAAGMDGYIAKPINSGELIRLVESFVSAH